MIPARLSCPSQVEAPDSHAVAALFGVQDNCTPGTGPNTCVHELTTQYVGMMVTSPLPAVETPCGACDTRVCCLQVTPNVAAVFSLTVMPILMKQLRTMMANEQSTEKEEAQSLLYEGDGDQVPVCTSSQRCTATAHSHAAMGRSRTLSTATSLLVQACP